jgi:tRNA-modifying protein YgfZ
MTETNWQTSFKERLKEDGAVYQEDTVQHYGNAVGELEAVTKGNTLCELSHLGLISLTGTDAVTFLQGQVTNDVTQLNNNNAHYSGYCSPKGRLLALFLAFSHNDHIYLQLNHPILAPIMKRLKMFVMRSKVDINDASHDLARFGINGPDASAILTKSFSSIPTQDYALMPIVQNAKKTGVVIKLPSINGHARYEILIDAQHASAAWDALKEDCKPVGKPCWDWLEIQTGIPDILEKTQEQFVPQMLNLDILNGINFKKGCYTGQEIVARTHYLGTIKRRTYLASISTDEQPAEGDKVIDSTQSEVGQIVKVAPNLNGGFDALIEIRIEAKQAGNITWKAHTVNFGTLPYSLKDEVKSDQD